MRGDGVTTEAMTTETIGDVITSKEQLRALVGEPGEGAVKKQLAYLDPHCQAFVARSPFLLIGTANARGGCDVSPRGDPAGFVLVQDERTILLPERPGNRRVDTLFNILENPHVGLIFLVPNVEETLRVNGTARIVRDAARLSQMAMQGKPPLLAIEVTVEEAFLHCAKAFKRARLWHADEWPDRSVLPSLGRMVADQIKLPESAIPSIETALEEDYRRLY